MLSARKDHPVLNQPTRNFSTHSLRASRSTPALWLIAATLLCAPFLSTPVLAQVNFKPLERGEYNEVEERVISVKGLEAGLDYALTVENREYKGLPPGGEGTRNLQDIRLKLKTTLHRDVALHLTLGPTLNNLQQADLRAGQAPESSDGRLRDAQPTTLGVRESYLRYAFNPRSFMLLGKHELSLGDRQGKVFNGIVPAYTLDCQAGTWCMPFGAAFIGKTSGDSIYHWSLQYNAWDEVTDGLRNTLSVEVFRVIYQEKKVPLGKNLGPTAYNPDFDPTDPTTALPGQVLDSTPTPVTYDTGKDNYYGVRWDLQSGWFYWNGDVIGHQGSRRYFAENSERFYKVRARAGETEIGGRWSTGQVGLRLMTASGDPYIDTATSAGYWRHLRGYHEITPGAYTGARLYFNGGDSQVDQGAGLGHSVNNTTLIGLVFRADDAENRQISYHAGLYKLRLNEAIPGKLGTDVTDIGIEWDNMLIWNVHKALIFQFEANLIRPGDAFRLNDYSAVSIESGYFAQGLVRLVYQF